MSFQDCSPKLFNASMERSDRVLVYSERSKSIRIDNPSGEPVWIAKLDRDVFPNECSPDLAICSDPRNLVILVEFKGHALSDARDQLLACAQIIRRNHKRPPKFVGIIVCGRVPMGGRDVTKMKETLRQAGFGAVIFKTREWVGTLDF
jgi:hypothetical protein